MWHETDEIDQDQAGEIIAVHGPFEMTSHGAIATQEATYAEWEAAIEWARKVEKYSGFWVGDLLLYGDRFGEASSQVLESTGYAEQTMANAKWVCKEIPAQRRRPDVPFSHHAEIAALPTPKEQDQWLDKCENGHLTREQLRVQLKAVKAQAAGQDVKLLLEVTCPTLEKQQELAQKLRQEGWIVREKAKTLSPAEAVA